MLDPETITPGVRETMAIARLAAMLSTLTPEATRSRTSLVTFITTSEDACGLRSARTYSKFSLDVAIAVRAVLHEKAARIRKIAGGLVIAASGHKGI